ncbi:hypothetical protein ABFB09_01830 [Dehalogenimonas sp. THU2]|uniref:hypothetical protein n=1 Tax=Dehalogenimonas sp. THU2 TaxID=3151121 RepID=UPI0032187B2F
MAREMTHCFVKIPVKPLDEATLERVKQLERKLGAQLIAFAAHNDEYARLTAEQLKEIDDLGKEIDAAIVAYSSGNTVQRRPRAC